MVNKFLILLCKNDNCVTAMTRIDIGYKGHKMYKLLRILPTYQWLLAIITMIIIVFLGICMHGFYVKNYSCRTLLWLSLGMSLTATIGLIRSLGTSTK